jgi:hypothetical protein
MSRSISEDIAPAASIANVSNSPPAVSFTPRLAMQLSERGWHSNTVPGDWQAAKPAVTFAKESQPWFLQPRLSCRARLHHRGHYFPRYLKYLQKVYRAAHSGRADPLSALLTRRPRPGPPADASAPADRAASLRRSSFSCAQSQLPGADLQDVELSAPLKAVGTSVAMYLYQGPTEEEDEEEREHPNLLVSSEPRTPHPRGFFLPYGCSGSGAACRSSPPSGVDSRGVPWRRRALDAEAPRPCGGSK